MPEKDPVLNKRECPGTYREEVIVNGRIRIVTKHCTALISYDATRCSACGSLFARGALSGWKPSHAKVAVNRTWAKQYLKGG